MGYVEIIDGSGLMATIENDAIKVEPTTVVCDMCNDDRLLREGDLLQCFSCHSINRIP
jgi:Zn finger protein HypA/HybF involved in hydrogenase expression